MKWMGIASALSLALVNTAYANEVVVPGSFAVSESGGATYSVDIDVPPGVAGMEPKLSLTYSSQGGNGLLGMGWSLSGLSSVTRCPKNIAQDGVRGAVRFDTDDRFCLDGQRLFPISGAHGASGTQYRTVMEGFSKITSLSLYGSGPAVFDVRTKSGLHFSYGGSWPSRLIPDGQSVIGTWNVSRVRDTSFNTMTFEYGQSSADSYRYPTRINYGANSANPQMASVRFTYEARTDIPRSYHEGSLFRTLERLKTIDTYVGSTLVARYTLDYAYSPTTNRSQLVSLEKCDGSNVCLPKTMFTYQAAPANQFSVVTNVAGQDNQWHHNIPVIGDFDGDGLADVFWRHVDTSQRSSLPATAAIWLSNGDGTVQTIGNVNGQNGQLIQYAPSAADFNGDGLSDILWSDQDQYGSSYTNMVVWLSNGDGTFTQVNTSATGGSPAAPTLHGHRMYSADFNGDGKTDLFFNHTDLYGRTSAPGTRFILLSNGDGTFQTVSNVNGQDGAFAGWSPSTGDFDGDGLSDILWMGAGIYGHSDSTLTIWFSQGDGTFTQVNTSANGGSPAAPALNGHLRSSGDFNADGKTDLLFSYSDIYGRTAGVATRILLLSKGDGSFHQISNVNGQDGSIVGFAPKAGDFNGDGLADVLWEMTGQDGHVIGDLNLWIGKGDGSFDHQTGVSGITSSNLNGHLSTIGDFNGDGSSDLLYFYADIYGRAHTPTGTRRLYLSTTAPDLLASVDDGFGDKVQLTYKPLTDDSIYTKGSGSVYPEVDLQVPSYVVSRAEVRDGIGGFVPTEYRYGGLKARADGRGSLGFAWSEAEQVETDFVTRRDYRQDYPYVGRVWLERTSAPGVGFTGSLSQPIPAGAGLLSEKTYAFDCLDISAGGTLGCTEGVTAIYFPYAASIVEKGWDLDGSVLPTVTTTNTYDAWGNATQIDVVTSDGFSKSTVNTYTNNAGAWILGRLTRTEVTDVSP